MTGKVDIHYSAKARKFFKRNPDRLSMDDVDLLIGKAILKLASKPAINIDLSKMSGRSKGKYRIRAGDIHIIFSIKQRDIYLVVVEDIDFRSNVYKLKVDRVDYQTTGKEH